MQADGLSSVRSPSCKTRLNSTTKELHDLKRRPGGERSRPWGGAARDSAASAARPGAAGAGGHRQPWGSLTRGPRALAAGPPASRRPQAVDDVVRDAGALGHREHEVAGDGARVAHQEGPVALPLQQRHRLGPAQPPPVPARPVLGVELPGHGGRPPAGRTRSPPTAVAPLRAQPCHPKWRPLP